MGDLTITDMAALVGATRVWNYAGLKIPVLIRDVRVSWGAVQVQITPAHGGDGLKWVTFDSLLPAAT